ncbi:MAG: alpha-mannosidase [Chloroflexota bacterium]
MRRHIPKWTALVVVAALSIALGAVALHLLGSPGDVPQESSRPIESLPTPDSSPTAMATASPTPTVAGEPPSDRVTAFYYGWYGTPAIDGRWRHWPQGGHTPPDDIGAAFMPAIGPYSSHDPAVLAVHMQELVAARVGTIAVSWWGPGSFDDLGLSAIIDAAGAAGIGVALHIEPYKDRTAASITRDIRAFVTSYGNRPGVARAIRPTAFGTSTKARPIVYVYQPRLVDEIGLRDGIDALRGTPADAIVLVQTTGVALVDRLHADGLYSYDVYAVDGTKWDKLLGQCRDKNYLCSPSVGPGYDERRATTLGRSIDRADGARYDAMWSRAIAAGAEWVSITSFNEWHEGTQIESALTPAGAPYADYEGAYGQNGSGAQGAYLDATATWIGRLEAP